MTSITGSIRPFSLLFAAGAVSLALAGCEKKKEATTAPVTAPTSAPPASGQAAGAGHDHGDDHAHDDDHDHHHGPTTELGTATIGGFAVKASRDGDITPGGDAPIDVWVTGGTARVAAVRFWIGTQNARGSIKARAELEKDNWHTHAEIPSPLPEGSRLWVEIETDAGERHVGGFDLAMP